MNFKKAHGERKICSPLSVFSSFHHTWLVDWYDLPVAVKETKKTAALILTS